MGFEAGAFQTQDLCRSIYRTGLWRRSSLLLLLRVSLILLGSFTSSVYRNRKHSPLFSLAIPLKSRSLNNKLVTVASALFFTVDFLDDTQRPSSPRIYRVHLVSFYFQYSSRPDYSVCHFRDRLDFSCVASLASFRVLYRLVRTPPERRMDRENGTQIVEREEEMEAGETFSLRSMVCDGMNRPTAIPICLSALHP